MMGGEDALWRRRPTHFGLVCCCFFLLVKGFVCQQQLNNADFLQLLTEQERHLYFGSSKHVPSFSIVSLELPRIRRRRRSPEEATLPEQVTLEALNQTFNFTIWPSRNLLADNFVMILRRHNYTDIFDDVWGEADCFYQGQVLRNGLNHTSSDSVAVGLCGGMRGFITSKDEYFAIAPLPQRFHKRSTDQQVPHIIWHRRTQAKTVCRHHHSNPQPQEASRRRRSSYLPYFARDNNGFFRRERRQGSFEPIHLYIETAVFVDRDLYKHMQINFPADTEKEVARIVLTLVNAVEHLYNDASLGYPVQFVLKRLEILASDPPALVRPYDIDHFLTSFCKWQRGENPSSDADPFHWDHALILTGLDLYVVNRNGKISNQVVGLAPVAGMCTRSSSCTVNEGRHFESVYVVAHEIGHNLGMRHDGPQADNDCDPGSYIMSPTLGSGKITWSPCSRRYLEMFLETSQSRCLRDSSFASAHLDHGADGRLPGERFDADKQCVLKYGRGSYHAPQQPMADVCRDLHCRREHYTWTSHPALEGTRCGERMWCRTGRCIHREASVTGFEDSGSREGGWGRWSPFTECASGCLYGEDGRLSSGSTGIMLANRRCETPRTHSADLQCPGTDKRYTACNAVQQCSSVRRTTIQEYADEICHRASEVDGELTGKGYQSISSDPERACSVWCYKRVEGSKTRGWFFPDGTVCHLEGRRASGLAYCIGGRCQEFTCEPEGIFRQEGPGCPDPLDVGSGSGLVPSSASGPASASGQTAGSSGDDLFPMPVSRDWSLWTPSSPCRVGCLAPARGLQLVTRECRSGGNAILGTPTQAFEASGPGYGPCLGLTTSVRLCRPDKPDCTRLKTPFEFATSVCSKYLERVSGLSGLGMQLSLSRDDPDRPCKVACQDERVSYRFYMVNGEDGWFPSGTDCSRGVAGKIAYCLGGRCVEFGHDDTPLYQPEYNLHRFERLFKRSLMINSTRIGSSLEESLLRQIIEKLNLQEANMTSPDPGSISGVDFSNPVHVSEVPLGSNSSMEDLNFIPREFSGFKESINFNRSHSQKPRDTRLPLNQRTAADASSTSDSQDVWLPSTADREGNRERTVKCTSTDEKLCKRKQNAENSGHIDCFRHPCEPIANPTTSFPKSGALRRWFSKMLRH